MKNLKAILILLISFSFLQIIPEKTMSAPLQASVSFQFFYDQLTPYGSWVSYPQYGYVWIPAAGASFRPYLTNGHWIFTDDGWMWASYYDWGWAPFHYGSWILDPGFGWVWVPGYNWAPAWVTWGDYNGYYGWAPVGPDFSFSFASYYPPIDYWCFMHPAHMTAAIYRDNYFVAHNRRIVLDENAVVINSIRNVTVINNVTKQRDASFNAGPRREEFENTAKTKVKQVSIRESAQPGKIQADESSVNIYRPRVAKESLTAAKPKKISTAEEVKHERHENGTKIESARQLNPGRPNNVQEPAGQNKKAIQNPPAQESRQENSHNAKQLPPQQSKHEEPPARSQQLPTQPNQENQMPDKKNSAVPQRVQPIPKHDAPAMKQRERPIQEPRGKTEIRQPEQRRAPVQPPREDKGRIK